MNCTSKTRYCRHVLAMILIRHPWLSLCSVLVFFICGCAWISCRGEYISPYPQHKPLFPSHGSVQEIPNGSLDVLSGFLRSSPFKFVMFYAPWCGQSRKAAPEFRRAANLLFDKVKFIAINCWTGPCKKDYSLDSYPKLFAYHTSFPGVQYPEAFRSSLMVRFLQRIVRPFIYIGRTADFQETILINQEVVVSYFEPDNLSGKNYSVFFGLALAHVGKVSKPCFAVVTNKQVAVDVGLNKTKEIVFHRAFSPITVYHPTWNSTVSNISDWIASNRKEFVTQLTPNATNKQQLELLLSEKAALILFLPVRRKKVYDPLMQLYTRAARQYHNCSCKNISKVNTVNQHQNVSNAENAVEMNIENIAPSSTVKQSTAGGQQVCYSLVVQGNQQNNKHNVCDICHQCPNRCSHHHRGLFTGLQARLLSKVPLVTRPCSTVWTTYDPGMVSTVCCSGLYTKHMTKQAKHLQGHQYEKKLNKLINNIFVKVLKAFEPLQKSTGDMENIKALLSTEATNIKMTSELRAPKVIKRDLVKQPTHTRPKESKQETGTYSSANDIIEDSCNRTGHVTQFHGGSCYSNRSVNFLYMDSDVYVSVAERLGVHWKAASVKVALVIVDIKNEAQYFLGEDKKLTNDTLVDFVMAYMTSTLKRTLRSAPPTPSSCHASHACVVEVTTMSFIEIVMNNDKDVLLVYYAPWCGLCMSLAPVLLTIARFFKDIEQVRIARIDADQNDLPWDLTVSSYPTIILFPAERKDSSVRFPVDAERTASSIIQFITEYGSEAVRRTIYGKDENCCDSDVMRNQLRQLEFRLQRVEQEKELLETRLEAAMMEKALGAFKNVKAMKGMHDAQQRLTKERESRVAAERVYRQAEASRLTAEEKLLDVMLKNAQLELQLQHRTEISDKVESLRKLATRRVLLENEELLALIDEVRKKLTDFKTLTSHLQKRERFLTRKVRHLQRTSKILTFRVLDYLTRNTKIKQEISELKHEKLLMTQLLRGAETMVSGLQASLSSAKEHVNDVIRERNMALNKESKANQQLDEMKTTYEKLNKLLSKIDIPKKRPAR